MVVGASIHSRLLHARYTLRIYPIGMIATINIAPQSKPQQTYKPVAQMTENGKKTRYLYGLEDSLIEPMSGVWATQASILSSTLRIDPEFILQTDDPSHAFYLPDRPLPGSSQEQDELDELLELASLRDNPHAVESTTHGRERRKISPFLLLRPPPYGAAVGNHRAENDPLIRTGRELARYFERETPGLAHRQALSFLMQVLPWSPVQQARVWMALDTAIYTAALAAWHYKWHSKRGPSVTYRPRPCELRQELRVLYDFDWTDTSDDGPRRDGTAPGTPRHPSYPSAHSTIASAASDVLAYFFPSYRSDLLDLADNAGLARLWAGVNYRSDHVNGLSLGKAVAHKIIEQLA